MRKLVFLIAVLGMAGVANAGANWTGNGNDGNFNTQANWDEPMFPPNPANSWKIHNNNLPAANVNITVTANVITTSGYVYKNTLGYRADLTIANNVTLTMNSGVNNFFGTGSLTLNPGSQCLMTNDFYMEAGGDFLVTIGKKWNGLGGSADGYLTTSNLRYNNNNKVDVWGMLRATAVNRIDAALDSFRVRDFGLFQVDSAIPASGVGWSKGGKVTQYLNSTVQLAANVTGYYSQLVQAAPSQSGGTWQVDYNVTKAGYTTIKYLPEPASLMLLSGLSLLLLRRRNG